MATDVLMPRLADTLIEGTVARWLKGLNEPVQAGEAIAEIETDKVTTELTAPVDGLLGEVLVQEGETVPVGAALARIHARDAESARSADASAIPQPAAVFSEAPVLKRASPLATRIAQAHQVDLAQVDANGSRITRADVERHLARPAAVPVPMLAVPGPGIQDSTVQATGNAGALPDTSGSSSTRDTTQPLTGLRKATAARMALVRQIPAGCAVSEADITELEQFSMHEQDAWQAREGFPLTYTPFFLSALAKALAACPQARQAWRNNRPESRTAVHLGVAVALADGLIVPVIRDADKLEFAALARASLDLVTRARARRLRPDEITGGVATLTNVGSMGGLLAFPMLNEDQAVILGIGVAERRAVGGPSGVHYRSRAYLSLTFDRRLLNDLQAERFLRNVSQILAGWSLFTPDQSGG